MAMGGPADRQAAFGTPYSGDVFGPSLDSLGLGGATSTPAPPPAGSPFLDGLVAGAKAVPVWQLAAGAFVLSLLAFGALKLVRK